MRVPIIANRRKRSIYNKALASVIAHLDTRSLPQAARYSVILTVPKQPFALAVLSILLCVALCACDKTLETRPLTITKSDGSTVTVKAEIARTKDERARGFMERKNIPDGTGMLFIFDRDQTLSFWMKNTPHPLSIAYIDSKGVMRDIFDMQPFDLNDVKSTFRARYALEVPQGWYETQGIREGDILTIDFDTRAN